MKKLYVILAAAMLMLSVAACKQSVEDKARDYVKEMKELKEAGKAEELMAKWAEMAEWYDSLSEEDQAKVDALDLDFD